MPCLWPLLPLKEELIVKLEEAIGPELRTAHRSESSCYEGTPALGKGDNNNSVLPGVVLKFCGQYPARGQLCRNETI